MNIFLLVAACVASLFPVVICLGHFVSIILFSQKAINETKKLPEDIEEHLRQSSRQTNKEIPPFCSMCLKQSTNYAVELNDIDQYCTVSGGAVYLGDYRMCTSCYKIIRAKQYLYFLWPIFSIIVLLSLGGSIVASLFVNEYFLFVPIGLGVLFCVVSIAFNSLLNSALQFITLQNLIRLVDSSERYEAEMKKKRSAGGNISSQYTANERSGLLSYKFELNADYRPHPYSSNVFGSIPSDSLASELLKKREQEHSLRQAPHPEQAFYNPVAELPTNYQPPQFQQNSSQILHDKQQQHHQQDQFMMNPHQFQEFAMTPHYPQQQQQQEEHHHHHHYHQQPQESLVGDSQNYHPQSPQQP